MGDCQLIHKAFFQQSVRQLQKKKKKPLATNLPEITPWNIAQKHHHYSNPKK